MKRTRTSMVIAALVVVGVVLTGGVAGARAGHFRVASTDGLTTDTSTTTAMALSTADITADQTAENVSITVKFLENGLGGSKSIDYRLDLANVSADLLCFNNGDNKPSDQKKSASVNAVSTNTQSLPITSKGVIDATGTGLTWNLVPIVAAAAGFSCPNGQSVRLTYLSVGGVTIVDTANNSSAAVTPPPSGYPLTWGTPGL